MPKLKISILDVGHGDFTYVRTPFDESIVIDCGSGEDVSPSGFLSQLSVVQELQVTHPHTDHFDDIVEFSKKKIASFRCPDLTKFSDEVMGWRDSDPLKIKQLRRLQSAVATSDLPVQTGNGFAYRVWGPSGVDYDDPNTASLVTILTYGSFKMLIGGDLPDSGWQTLVSSPQFVKEIAGTTVFRVPHHGRAEGCSDALFEAFDQYPMLNVISDKPIDDTNRDTVATAWYTARAQGAKVVGEAEQRFAITTRDDNSIFIETDGQYFSVYRNTRWRAD